MMQRGADRHKYPSMLPRARSWRAHKMLGTANVHADKMILIHVKTAFCLLRRHLFWNTLQQHPALQHPAMAPCKHRAKVASHLAITFQWLPAKRLPAKLLDFPRASLFGQEQPTNPGEQHNGDPPAVADTGQVVPAVDDVSRSSASNYAFKAFKAFKAFRACGSSHNCDGARC